MVRRVLLAVLVLGLVVAGWVGWVLFNTKPEHEPPEQVHAGVVGATADGWQVVAYNDLRLELPPGWARLDGDCESSAEHWGPTELGPCAQEVGVWFYGSATFDPADGPGTHPVDATDNLPDGGFGGYVTPGDVAVYAQDVDQEVVRRVLRSVRQATAV